MIKNNNKAITLMTLIITIALLLIISTITLTALDANGIIGKAKDAREDVDIEREKTKIYEAVIFVDNFNAEDIKNKIGVDKVKTKKQGEYISVEFIDSGRRYKVDVNGNIIENREPEEATDVYQTIKNNSDGTDTKTLILTASPNTEEGVITSGKVTTTSGIRLGAGYHSSITRVEIKEPIKPKGSTSKWFHMFGKIKTIEGLDNLYTSEVTDMSSMFYRCYELEELDLSNFDTSNVTLMNGMFSECSALKSVDVSSFDTSKVTNMAYMFRLTQLTTLDLKNFNTSAVQDMQYMFYGCNKMTSLNISSFNTQSVTNMQYMFAGCNKMTSLNISSFNTQSVTNMQYMFYNNSALKEVDISGFNTSNVTNMNSMFQYCYYLSTTINIDPTKLESYTNCFNQTSRYEGGIIIRCKQNDLEKVQGIVNGNTKVTIEVIQSETSN